MKTVTQFCTLLTLVLVISCSSTQSIQEYYVDSAENPNFISLDLPASILNLEEANLSDTQKEAIQSLKKLNILAFRKTAANAAEFEIEKGKVNAIFKNSSFKELMKLNSSYGKGFIKYSGEEDAIDEVIIYGNSNDKGFALIRVLGNDMNPAHLVQLMQAIQQSDYKGEGLGEIGEFLKG